MFTRDGFRIYGWDDDRDEIYVHQGDAVHGRESRWLLVFGSEAHPRRACLAPSAYRLA